MIKQVEACRTEIAFFAAYKTSQQAAGNEIEAESAQAHINELNEELTYTLNQLEQLCGSS